MEKNSAFDDIVFLTDDHHNYPNFADFLHKQKETMLPRTEFYVTTKREEVVVINETFWDKDSLIKIEADNIDFVRNFLKQNFRGKYANIYLNVPLINVLFRRGVVRSYSI